jgi:hypothetical protein
MLARFLRKDGKLLDAAAPRFAIFEAWVLRTMKSGVGSRKRSFPKIAESGAPRSCRLLVFPRETLGDELFPEFEVFQH